MTVEELYKKYGQHGRQCGTKLLFITSDGIEETIHGYVIASWSNSTHEPLTVYSDIHVTAPMTPEIKIWDDAHDALFGKPGAPEFGRNSINL